jgi:hypothetical protein
VEVAAPAAPAAAVAEAPKIRLPGSSSTPDLGGNNEIVHPVAEAVPVAPVAVAAPVVAPAPAPAAPAPVYCHISLFPLRCLCSSTGTREEEDWHHHWQGSWQILWQGQGGGHHWRRREGQGEGSGCSGSCACCSRACSRHDFPGRAHTVRQRLFLGRSWCCRFQKSQDRTDAHGIWLLLSRLFCTTVIYA